MPPWNRPVIHITIVDDSRGEKCDARCGVDWSSPEVIALASQRTRDRFGEGIHLDYVDLARPVADHRTLKLGQQCRNKKLPLPLLVVDGQPRISGQFDIHLLLDAIDAEMEIRQ